MKNSDAGLLFLAFALGVPLFLISEYHIIFRFVFVPVVIFIVIRGVIWLRSF